MVDGRVLLLLDLQHSAVFESPLHDVGLLASALCEFGLAHGGPELGEVLRIVSMARMKGFFSLNFLLRT